jgi:large subunit ribosomal protein L18
MNSLKRKIRGRLRRKRHIRKSIFGTAEKPRLTVFRSHQNIFCQIVDDARGITLASCSSQQKDLRESLGSWGGNCSAAQQVGKGIAEKAIAAGISPLIAMDIAFTAG